MRNYQVDYTKYTFKEEDDWGDYYNGEYRKPYFNKNGYGYHDYWCSDGKCHRMCEHTAKWEYFNGRILEGLQIDHIIPVERSKTSHTKGTNKMSNLRLVTPLENNNNPITRYNMSVNSIGKNKGRPKPEGSGKLPKITFQYNLENGELIASYNSRKTASFETNIDGGSITKCCCGILKQAGGYGWSYKLKNNYYK